MQYVVATCTQKLSDACHLTLPKPILELELIGYKEMGRLMGLCVRIGLFFRPTLHDLLTLDIGKHVAEES